MGLKLLYITNGINGAGGLERVLSIKASYLADKMGYEVHILVLNDAHFQPFYQFSDKITFHSIDVKGNPLQYFWSYKKGIQQIADEVRVDVISVCDDGLKGFTIPSFLKTTAKVIYERHASIEMNKNTGFMGKLSTILMKIQSSKFDQFIVLTPANVKEWKIKNIVVIPNPLSFVSTKNNLLDRKKVIVVGSHSYNKGYDKLLTIWKKVEAKFPDWELNIYGKIDKDETFVKVAKRLELQEVNFHHPISDIKSQYEDSSIMLLTSRSEGFGMVLIEAMACGVPCVSFDCPSGPGDIISDKEDGFLVEDQNEEAFTVVLEQLMSNHELRKKIGVKGKENVERFSIPKVLEQWDQLFKSL
ncbi:glycosyltransferase family 4 protein [Chryseobacterium sp. T1]